MDSLTHLVLGAAIGEVVLGKKIGNRALIWGAIGETIPDFDVLGNLFLNPTGALAFHRGFTHSILFAIGAPLLFGWLVYKLYHTDRHKKPIYKALVSIINALVLGTLVLGSNYMLRVENHPRWWYVVISLGIGAYLIWRLYKYYIKKDLESFKTTHREWYLLFFLAFMTHILLDSCTTYGTQLFLPFSDYRVSFKNISVADLFFTIPFLICAIIFPFYKRNTKTRTVINYIGMGYAALYLLFTFGNKIHMNHVFERALSNRGIEATRWRTDPTILNNFLWTFVAETPDNYYVGLYSNFDHGPDMHYLNTLPKNDSIMQAYSKYKSFKTIKWFSDGYLNASPADTVTVLSDLRYGGIQDTIKNYNDMVFNFFVKETDGELQVVTDRTPMQGSFSDILKKFIKRVKGY
ncbi:MAG: metal-dependent hydrolase [Saprospiraceae bacterium]